ncbi:hypothetical protein FJ422_16375 [Mesorhizobium sp. B2-6-3]|uniref:HI1506-related protein n=1 Tax=Mesorhizobium sp. B2-6-3 TaxID=2589914 RepID=UPI001125EF17|nr:HI1506-related protein [Mesorhizobium sp. B2-6-3]TPJ83848.1 hypothetical protein FJ422_16375 [Mesorhizobium sp. B2-6-3]
MAKATKSVKVSKGETALPAGKPTPAAGLDAAGRPSEPAASLAASDAPPSTVATGTLSTDTREQSDQGGPGNGAGSAGSLTLEDLEKRLGTAENEFRSKFPRMAAAIDAWQSSSADGEVPSGIRIRSKIDGFRRAGIAHSKEPVEHGMEAFKGPEQLEALFAEPNLVVELI